MRLPVTAILTTLFLLNACSTPPASVTVIDILSPRWKICEEKCAAAKEGKVRIDISLASCTAQLLDESGELLAEMDVSPGVPEHKTPEGSFYVREKLPVKNSNLYGQYVKFDTREVVVARAWEHKGKRPEGTEYQGIAMPFWLRLTNYGVGVHVGGFNRGQPSSHGCIRCPEPGQRVFWEKSRVGTPVRVHNGPHPARSLLNPPPGGPALAEDTTRGTISPVPAS